MPNFDGGHYFLTVIAPIRTDIVPIGDDRYRSHVDLLRELLSRLPTARQNVVTHDAPLNSPFARNRLNHLARFVVIDDAVYNGRSQTDPLLGQIKKINPIEAQPVDRLKCSYLFLGADIDAGPASDPDASLRRYTDSLWSTMREELTEVFGHCLGFEQVTDADGFFRYIERCRIETTMPFNDYWIKPIPAKSLSLTGMVGVLGIGALTTVVAFLLQVVGFDGADWGRIGLIALVGTAALAVGSYHYLVAKAQTPFPTAPNSDLPSVLKALYLQQRFTDFAISNQGADAETLYREFGAFAAAERPDDLDQPTQQPGVIDSRKVEDAA
ncbi:MAG: hypothetical protein WBG92_21545 [Thiohalocapsa sp.]